jgi:GT2 family glycosyltransferase
MGELGLAADLAKEIWRVLRAEIAAHLSADGLPPCKELSAAGLPCAALPPCLRARQAILDNPPFVSIIIGTRDRPDQLRACLRSLLMLDYPRYEIVVVDNAPSTSATADLMRQEYGASTRVRYLREDYPGVAAAHNHGLAHVQSELVAIADDDVVVDRHWLIELVRGFAVTENVGCVTGMIFPAEIETPTQGWIEQSVGFNKGFAPRVFDLSENKPKHPLYPYTPGMFGSGANMAFKTAALRAIGGFDPALGAGTLALGGEDLAAMFDIVTHGYRLVYQPAAIVQHWHRRDYAGLRRQAYGYGVGLAAFLTRAIVVRPSRLFDFIVRIPAGLAYVFSARSPINARKSPDYPSELTQIERRGMLAGPFRYLRSRWQARTRS